MNHISSYKSIEQLGHDLEATLKIPMNHVGGLVKGSKDVYLEQIATLACDMRVAFQEGIWTVPYGFVEFAQRHPIGNELFQGFVADNADKIFESTDVDANNDSEL
jgi:hypothetical protein